MGGQQEAPCAAGRVADRLAGLGCHGIDDGGDQGAGGKVLTSASLHIGGILFQQSLVGIPLDIDTEARPLFLVDEVHNQAAELGRVLNLILSLAKARAFPDASPAPPGCAGSESPDHHHRA